MFKTKIFVFFLLLVTGILSFTVPKFSYTDDSNDYKLDYFQGVLNSDENKSLFDNDNFTKNAEYGLTLKSLPADMYSKINDISYETSHPTIFNNDSKNFVANPWAGIVTSYTTTLPETKNYHALFPNSTYVELGSDFGIEFGITFDGQDVSTISTNSDIKFNFCYHSCNGVARSTRSVIDNGETDQTPYIQSGRTWVVRNIDQSAIKVASFATFNYVANNKFYFLYTIINDGSQEYFVIDQFADNFVDIDNVLNQISTLNKSNIDTFLKSYQYLNKRSMWTRITPQKFLDTKDINQISIITADYKYTDVAFPQQYSYLELYNAQRILVNLNNLSNPTNPYLGYASFQTGLLLKTGIQPDTFQYIIQDGSPLGFFCASGISIDFAYDVIPLPSREPSFYFYILDLSDFFPNIRGQVENNQYFAFLDNISNKSNSYLFWAIIGIGAFVIFSFIFFTFSKYLNDYRLFQHHDSSIVQYTEGIK